MCEFDEWGYNNQPWRLTDNMIMELQPTSGVLTYHREIDILRDFDPYIEDVFRALPHINRFNGHTKYPYSVARHSIQCELAGIMVHNITKPHILLALLLHDAGEVYIGDIIRSVKNLCDKRIWTIESNITKRLIQKFVSAEQLEEIYSPEVQDLITLIDNRMAATEADMLRDPGATKILVDFERYALLGDTPYVSVEDVRNTFKREFRFLLAEIKEGGVYED